MNYQKLDAALASAIARVENPEERNLVVFVQAEPVPDAQKADFLEHLGVSGASSERDIFTATLSAREVGELSEQRWVQSIRLSQKLHLKQDR